MDANSRVYEMDRWVLGPTWGGRMCLRGVCPARRLQLQPDRPEKANKPLTTSYIVSIEGKTVTTVSGSVYNLKDPDPDWRVPEDFDVNNPRIAALG